MFPVPEIEPGTFAWHLSMVTIRLQRQLIQTVAYLNVHFWKYLLSSSLVFTIVPYWKETIFPGKKYKISIVQNSISPNFYNLEYLNETVIFFRIL